MTVPRAVAGPGPMPLSMFALVRRTEKLGWFDYSFDRVIMARMQEQSGPEAAKAVLSAGGIPDIW